MDGAKKVKKGDSDEFIYESLEKLGEDMARHGLPDVWINEPFIMTLIKLGRGLVILSERIERLEEKMR